jgi:hypothetical protein
MRYRSGPRIVALLLLVWLLIGLAAAWQRGYLKGGDRDSSCAKTGTILVTVIAGPLNYVGANPKVHHCSVPEPSK